MSKRKQSAKEDSDSDSSDVSLIDVDFDFFDPNPTVDYHAIKRLLVQLFQGDAEQFQLHELTEIILSQPVVGTTIKTDGKESDPYALLTVLNMHVHQNHPSIKALASYIVQKASQSSDKALHSALQSLFSQSEHHVGLVICERLINMPVQVIPPMYRMLSEELKWATDDNLPFTFSHLLFISRTYHLSPAEESALSLPPSSQASKPPSSKKSKKSKSKTPAAPIVGKPVDGVYSFHPEDECIIEASLHTTNYQFSSAVPRGEDAFGLDTRGRIMLIPMEKFSQLVEKMAVVYSVE